MRNKFAVSVLALALGISLAGCKKAVDAANQAARDAVENVGGDSPASDNADEAWAEKANLYISVGNRLGSGLECDGITEAAIRWCLEDEEKVKQGDFKEIKINTHLFEGSHMDELRKAVTLPASTPEADEAARAVLAAADQYLPNWKALVAYNKSKKYEDDGGEEGRRRLAEYNEGVVALRAALAAFKAEVNQLSGKLHEKTLEEAKKEGRLLEVHTLQAMGSAEKIIDTFGSSEDFKDAAKIEAANKHLAEMETAIEGMRSEHAKRKAENTPQNRTLPMIDRYDSIISSLVSMAGNYRTARNNDPQEFNDAVRDYNQAVEAYNMMNR